MKLVSYRLKGKESYGVVVEDGVVDLGKKLGKKAPTLRAALEAKLLPAIKKIAKSARKTDVPLNKIEFLPVIPNPDKIVCIGLNYATHIKETGRDMPAYPMLFSRYPNSQVGQGQPLIRPKASEKFDFEGELAVIIGRRGRHISKDKALSYVAGYSCYNDGSIRDWQRHTAQYMPGKNFFKSGSFGPWLVTTDEIRDPSKLTLETRLNGEVMQRRRRLPQPAGLDEAGRRDRGRAQQDRRAAQHHQGREVRSNKSLTHPHFARVPLSR